MEDLAWNEISDQVVILETRDNRVFHELNQVGSTIWKSMNGENTVEDVLKIVLDEYDVTSEEARSDIMDFINKLRDKDLIA